MGGHFGDSRIHTAEPNPLLFTPADGTSHPPVEENGLRGKTKSAISITDSSKVLGLWVAVLLTTGNFETVCGEIPLPFQKMFASCLTEDSKDAHC